MKLKDALVENSNVKIYQVQDNEGELFDDEDFLSWDLRPIYAETLSAESADNGILDGHFILKAVQIRQNGDLSECYINVTLPERISDQAYLLKDENIIEQWKHTVEGDVIPLVAIEGFGLYELYYSKINPEIGIEVLRKGLQSANKKTDIALDLAYILRDENRYLEAIEAFTIVINEVGINDSTPLEYVYSERAGMYEAIGEFEKAASDVKKSEQVLFERRQAVNKN
jgi:tetratricopeptide (TPR) repeat protein